MAKSIGEMEIEVKLTGDGYQLLEKIRNRCECLDDLILCTRQVAQERPEDLKFQGVVAGLEMARALVLGSPEPKKPVAPPPETL